MTTSARLCVRESIGSGDGAGTEEQSEWDDTIAHEFLHSSLDVSRRTFS